MRYIKFFMSKGRDFTFPENEARRILKDEKQLVTVFDEKGQWTGETINRGHIVSTDFDLEREREEAMRARMMTPKLPEGIDAARAKAGFEKMKALRRGLVIKMIIRK